MLPGLTVWTSKFFGCAFEIWKAEYLFLNVLPRGLGLREPFRLLGWAPQKPM